ncbi:TIGR03766 family XrtG-associated glycosyltransferase [Liquorilactobacillus aquaticus]|nr:TIGR03766 family XrtG-associated glycosyltransferase [Liquorilactobacillus aquaticus]
MNSGTLILFSFFILLTFFFALTSSNIILGDNQITGAGTTFFTTVWLIILGAIVICFKTFKKVNRFMYYLFIKQRLKTATILLLLVICGQVFFVLTVHPAIGFDAGAIHQALTDRTSVEIKAYYSINYNNLPLLLLQNFFVQLFASKTWLFFDLLTLLFVDLSMLFNLISVAIVDRSRLATAIYLHVGWLLVFPMIIVPYTDTWVLPIVSGYLLCYCIAKSKKTNLLIKLLAIIGFSILLVAAYFLKPSAVIGGIAIGIGELLFSLSKLSLSKWRSWYSLGAILFSGVVILGSHQMINQRITGQKYIQVDQSRAIPAIHFISMGVSGDGGYNPKDALAMAQIPTKAGRTAYSRKMLVKRLKNKGFFGYISFLFKKHQANTADGSFAWVKEGHFIAENPKPSKHGWAGQLKQFIYLYGTRLGDFRFAAQLWWIILLGIIALSWRDRRSFVQILRLALIGGFIYLLIFEGGRSRYLIQFLPYFLIMGALTFKHSLQTMEELISFLRYGNTGNKPGNKKK